MASGFEPKTSSLINIEITSSEGNESHGDYEELFVFVIAETYDKNQLTDLHAAELSKEGKEAAPEGQQQQASPIEFTTADRPLRSVLDQQVADETPTPRIPVRTIWIDPEDGTIYLDIEINPLSCAPVQTLTSLEWSSGSLLVSPASLSVPSPVASPMTTSAATIAVDEDVFLEVGVQLELYKSILHDHTQRLDALPPILLEGHERAQEQATITFSALWQPVLALENTAIQCELQEMRDCVTTLEQERSSREQ
ncbi:hypothetical protein Tco_0235762 [Tanacetum coccineum]